MCIYVAGAAFAKSLARGRRGTCFNRRCLLESDGTLDITAPTTASGDGSAGSADFTPFANMTSLEIEELVDAFQNWTGSTDLSDNFTSSLKGHTSLGSGNVSSPIVPNPSGPYEPVPVPQIDSAGQILPDPGSSKLNCPCNCTYVSAACCLSKTVWEDA